MRRTLCHVVSPLTHRGAPFSSSRQKIRPLLFLGTISQLISPTRSLSFVTSPTRMAAAGSSTGPSKPNYNSISLHVGDSTFLTSGTRQYPPMVSVPVTTTTECPLELKEIVKPPNVDDLYEWYTEVMGQPDADPSWGVVWPTAVSLANYLVEHPELVRDKRVVELGCGVGLCGLVAAGLGASSVTLTDREPFALHCAMSTAALLNPNDKQEASTNKNKNAAEAAVVDWNNVPPNLQGTMDVILASDVLYDESCISALAKACQALANHKSEKVLVLITDPVIERYPGARDLLKSFFDKMNKDQTSINALLEKELPHQLWTTDGRGDDDTTADARDHSRRMKEDTLLLQFSISGK